MDPGARTPAAARASGGARPPSRVVQKWKHLLASRSGTASSVLLKGVRKEQDRIYRFLMQLKRSLLAAAVPRGEGGGPGCVVQLLPHREMRQAGPMAAAP